MTPVEIEIVSLSLRVAGAAVLVALPLAFIVAWLFARRDFPGRSLAQALVMLPLVVPPVVTGYALLVLFGTQGSIGAPLREWFGFTFAFRWTGAALAAGVMAFPLLVRPIRISLEGIDPALTEMARTLGVGRLRRFLTITLPLSLPGLIAGGILGFAKALGEFGATITFVSNVPGETQTLSLAIYSLLQSPSGDEAALRLIGFSVVLALGAVIISELVQRRLVAGATQA